MGGGDGAYSCSMGARLPVIPQMTFEPDRAPTPV